MLFPGGTNTRCARGQDPGAEYDGGDNCSQPMLIASPQPMLADSIWNSLNPGQCPLSLVLPV